MREKHTLLSIVVPVYNEADGIEVFHRSLVKVLDDLHELQYEIIYCDDGSSDNSNNVIAQFCDDKHIKLVTLSRNFGKEYALTAALAYTQGDAVICIDADGQHPVSVIPKFIAAWRDGADVVIGQRTEKDTELLKKRFSSKLFYSVFNSISTQKIDPRSTDYRLLDRAVVDNFLRLAETDRLSRGLIDWLGFTRVSIDIPRQDRIAGTASYSIRKLAKLALDSLVSTTSRPLYILFIVGGIIMFIAGLLGLAVFFEQIILRDPLQWKFTGTAMLGIMILFLVGLVILAQGIVSLYIATTYNQVKARPLYIVNKKKSLGINEIHENS